ncbi:MAG: alanine--tRNA ligase [bacterium]|nr:alanine--tRNA ligase [bacterium]
MSSEEIRKSFLDFFKSKGHTVVPSSSLLPTDPSVLLTTAGMQQFKPYFTGELNAQKDFGSLNVCSVQKCFRTSDIDEVGDNTHLTFFEMLGNFSFGGYFKKEAIHFAFEYVTKVLGVNPELIYVTIFAGESATAAGGASVPYDSESFDIWHNELGMPAEKIFKRGRADNFWGPTGNEGPCGPTTEIYVARNTEEAKKGEGVEIWNNVFNQFYQRADTTLEKLKTPGIDTGMGFERLATIMQGAPSVFETDIFSDLIAKIREMAPGIDNRVVRILADHLRSSIFLVADGVRPSNKEAGYILRRLLRRVLAYQTIHDVHGNLLEMAVSWAKEKFGNIYPEVKEPRILEVLEAEKDKFEQAIALGVKEIKKYKEIGAKEGFYLYETFGLPFELIRELASEASKNLDRGEFDEEFKKHQEISRAGVEKKFGGHGLLLDTGELKAKDAEELQKVTRLHTATHLMQAALRKVLGNEVQQKGSDITVERTRFDFIFPRKLTPKEIKKVEDLVNEVIQKDLPVGFIEMPKEEGAKTGALHFFLDKYPEKVKVYYVGHDLDSAFSKEFCGGPHVDHTLTIGKFRIAKEEAVSAGVRRIRGVVE